MVMGMGTVSARSAEHGDVMKILVSTCRSALGLCCSHHLKLSKPSIRRRIAASIMALRRRCDLEEGIHWNGRPRPWSGRGGVRRARGCGSPRPWTGRGGVRRWRGCGGGTESGERAVAGRDDAEVRNMDEI
jgi:hypothetical protein